MPKGNEQEVHHAVSPGWNLPSAVLTLGDSDGSREEHKVFVQQLQP